MPQPVFHWTCSEEKYTSESAQILSVQLSVFSEKKYLYTNIQNKKQKLLAPPDAPSMAPSSLYPTPK